MRPDPDEGRPLRKWVEGPAWVLRGCQNCGGDLYSTEVDKGIEFFECLLCGHEHTRKAGTKHRPRLL